MFKRTKYTEEEFKEAVKTSLSISQALTKLKLRPTGGNYKEFNKRAKEHNIDISHFTGQGWNTGDKNNLLTSIPLDLNKIFSNEITCATYTLKIKLYKAELKAEKCEKCNITHWNNAKAPLELHHIDGNCNNNNLENLQILCCNCHAQTPTFRRRNSKKYSLSKYCSSCDQKIYPRNKSGLCRTCYNRNKYSK